MLVELIVGVAIGYIPCELVPILSFGHARSSTADVDNFGLDIPPGDGPKY
jgi:hypothetical protein